MKNILFWTLLLIVSGQLSAQNTIVRYEYWFDDSYDSRTQTAVAPSGIASIQTDIPSQLDLGAHTLNIRFMDSKGLWSATLSNVFLKIWSGQNNTIVAYEYWTDDRDSERRSGTLSPEQTCIFADDVVASGSTIIHFRFKDSTGLWSSVFTSRPFLSVGNDAVAGKGISVYPNPVKDRLYVQSTSDTVSGYSLYSMSGTLLLRGNAGGNQVEIDMSGYQAGLYILKVETSDGGWSVHRVIHN